MAGHDLLVARASEIERSDPEQAVAMLAEAAEACIHAGGPAGRPARGGPARLGAAARGGAGAGHRLRMPRLRDGLVYNGDGEEGAEHIRRAVALLESSDVLSSDPRSLSSVALGPLWLREAETGASLIERAIETARRRGVLGALPGALSWAGRDAATSDCWAQGRALYEEAIALARETGQGTPLCTALVGLATLDARQGRVEACRRHAAEAAALADRHGLKLALAIGARGRGGARARPGSARAGAAELEEKQRRLAELGVTDPDLSVVPELV
jgi:hypothetical protein